MAFFYSPPPESTVGRDIGRGIASAGASIGAALEQVGQRQRELKGYKTLLEAYADDPTSGINKESIDKMSLPQAKSAILAAEFRRSRAQETQRGEALANFLKSVQTDTAPKTQLNMPPLGQTYRSLIDTSAPPLVTTQPGMNFRDAIIAGLNKNPAMLQTDVGTSVLGAALKSALTTPRGDFQPFNMNGVSGVVDPSTGRVIQAKTSNPSDRYKLPLPPQGGYYEKLKTKSGRDLPGWVGIYDKNGTLLEARQDPQSAPRENLMDLLKQFGASSDENEIPTVNSQQQYNALDSGAAYYDSAGNLRRKK